MEKNSAGKENKQYWWGRAAILNRVVSKALFKRILKSRLEGAEGLRHGYLQGKEHLPLKERP